MTGKSVVKRKPQLKDMKTTNKNIKKLASTAKKDLAILSKEITFPSRDHYNTVDFEPLPKASIQTHARTRARTNHARALAAHLPDVLFSKVVSDELS